MQLAVECGVGIAVFVRCFTDKTAIEDQIGEKLGYGLSRAPFATIVVSFSPFFIYLVSCYTSELLIYMFPVVLMDIRLGIYDFATLSSPFCDPWKTHNQISSTFCD